MAAPSPPPTKPVEAPPGVSWTGLIGGLLGLGPMAAVGIEFLVDPPDEGRALAAVPLAMSVVYLPAIWASVSATPRRRAVLRGVVAASIAMYEYSRQHPAGQDIMEARGASGL